MLVNVTANNSCTHINPFISSPVIVLPISEKTFIKTGIDIIQKSETNGEWTPNI